MAHKNLHTNRQNEHTPDLSPGFYPGSGICHAIKMQGMVFRYTWVYSKEDTMAHTHRPVVTS